MHDLLVGAITSPLRFQGREQRILGPCFQTALAIIIFRTVEESPRSDSLVNAVFFADNPDCVCGTRFLLGEGI